MSSSATNKPRDDNNNDNEDEDDLQQLTSSWLEGDEFITQEEQREREAEKRRLERKRRLQRLQADDEPAVAEPAAPTKAVKKEEEEEIVEEKPPKIKVEEEEEEDENDDDDDDGFDMFSSSVSPVAKESTAKTTTTAAAAASTEEGTQQDWDDAEGYYKAVIGELITIDSIDDNNNTQDDNPADATFDAVISFRVSGVIGKGVFSTVLKCTTVSNATSIAIPPTVAIKFIRHNETMAKTAFDEIRYLQRLNYSPGIVPLLLPTISSSSLEHKGHVMLVFPCAEHNLREVLHRFGKGVGLSLDAVRSYFGQLLSALSHLKKHSLIHADIKLDNMLIGSNDFSVVQLCDFGSALDVVSSTETQQPTPYLVSRFYRAPDVILGLVPTFAVDLWSVAVSVAELFLGDVVFKGKNNNDMLYCFMQHLGPFSNRMIRQHLVQCQKMPGIPTQFTQRQEGAGSDYLFIQHTEDPVTGKPVNKYVSLATSSSNNNNGDNNNNGREVFPSTPLSKKILKAKSAKDSRTMVLRFADLLQKCLALDPSRRISLKDALQHDFFTKNVTSS